MVIERGNEWRIVEKIKEKRREERRREEKRRSD